MERRIEALKNDTHHFSSHSGGTLFNSLPSVRVLPIVLIQIGIFTSPGPALTHDYDVRYVVHDVRPHTSLALTPPIHRRNIRDPILPPDTRQVPNTSDWNPKLTRKSRKTSQPLPPFENNGPCDLFAEPDCTTRKIKPSTYVKA